MTAPDLLQMVIRHSGNQYAQDRLTNYFSKYGISARTHAHINIKDLTEAEAMAIHRADFYDHFKFKDLPPKLRAITYTTGILLGFPEAFKLLSQAVQYFPVREELTADLLLKIDSINPEISRARVGTLLVLWLSDHNLLNSNIRSLMPRVMESVSS